MSELNLNEKTVIELRKLAKEMKVPLSAGISKQGIIDKLTQAMDGQAAAPAPVTPAAAEETPTAEAEEAPSAAEEVQEAEAESQPAPEEMPAFRQAYVAPARFNSKPAYQAPAYGRSNTPRPAMTSDAPRTQTTRPVAGFSPRFGPAASAVDAAPAHEDDFRTARNTYGAERKPAFDAAPRFQQRPAPEAPRPAVPEQRPTYEGRPAYEPRPSAEQRPAYDSRPSYDQRPAYDSRPGYDQRPAYDSRPGYESRPSYGQRREPPTSEAAPVHSQNPSVNELIAPAEAPECSGVLELMPEGYGFLRLNGVLPSAKDVYVAAAQVRRFGLRTGDRLSGKCRPQRDGDKYPAMLIVTEVNGSAPDAVAQRPSFDALTPIYPTRRICLERRSGQQHADLRLVDLITPIGFGQRGLIQCGPRTGKTRLLQHLANVIRENHPEAHVMVLLFNETPEDVTVFRELVTCPVLATTFDMAPENHLKLTDMVLEQAQRMVELKRDVVLLVDSLTTLTKVASTAALQQGRVVPGMVNPASLHKAKRLFGAARCLREGGSLTVIATMNMDNGNKVDDSVINEFRAAANMELVLDQTLAKAGIYPPIALAHSGTRKAEAILSPAHMEGIKLIRGILSTLPAANAVQELKSMMEKAPTNEDLLVRIKDWVAAIQA